MDAKLTVWLLDMKRKPWRLRVLPGWMSFTLFALNNTPNQGKKSSPFSLSE